MQLNPAEISELLKSKIQNLNVGADARNQGQSCRSRTGSAAFTACRT
jgi:hypothetical protein